MDDRCLGAGDPTADVNDHRLGTGTGSHAGARASTGRVARDQLGEQQDHGECTIPIALGIADRSARVWWRISTLVHDQHMGSARSMLFRNS